MRFSIFLILISAALIAAENAAEHQSTAYPWPEFAPLPDPPKEILESVSAEGAELGRHLFYDRKLSSKGLSCNDCHKQEHAFGDNLIRNKNSARNRNTPALFNLMWQSQFSWSAEHHDLHSQTSAALHEEMDIDWISFERVFRNDASYLEMYRNAFGKKSFDSTLIIDALVQFQLTLVSNSSRYDSILMGYGFFNEEERLGFELMNDQVKGACLHCHPTDANALGSNYLIADNGLQEASELSEYVDKGFGEHSLVPTDIGKFKTPSVRNLLFSKPFMHDGSIPDIDSLLIYYSSQVHRTPNLDSKLLFPKDYKPNLSEKERDAIRSFLICLSDSNFIGSARFSNPFTN